MRLCLFFFGICRKGVLFNKGSFVSFNIWNSTIVFFRVFLDWGYVAIYWLGGRFFDGCVMVFDLGFFNSDE